MSSGISTGTTSAAAQLAGQCGPLSPQWRSEQMDAAEGASASTRRVWQPSNRRQQRVPAVGYLLGESAGGLWGRYVHLCSGKPENKALLGWWRNGRALR